MLGRDLSQDAVRALLQPSWAFLLGLFLGRLGPQDREPLRPQIGLGVFKTDPNDVLEPSPWRLGRLVTPKFASGAIFSMVD